MERKILAYMYESFKEYDEHRVRDNSNLVFGGGKCPNFNYVIDSHHKCPKDCKFFKEAK